MFYLFHKKRLFHYYLKQSLFFCFFLSATISYSQEYSFVDKKVATYSSKIATIQLLTATIEQDFKTDNQRVRALYQWLTHHIEYNLNEYHYGADNYSFSYASAEELKEKIAARNNTIVKTTMSSKKAICEGYAETFKRGCELMNIQATVISGYSRTPSSKIGHLPLNGKHAWNAVYVDAQWKLIDVTWGAGYSRDSNYWVQSYDEHFYFTDPKALIATHYPEEKQWQLLDLSMTKEEFTNQPLYSSLFFKEDMQLVSPTTGIIEPSKAFFILKLKHVKPDIEFGYAFEKDYYLTTLIPEFQNNIAILKIPLTGKKQTSLNILSGTDMVLQFRVE